VAAELGAGFNGKSLLGLAFSLIPVIVLLNMRRRQRQVHEGRRRYQDIFEGTGVALCVLDLMGLNAFFDKTRLETREQLHAWLQDHPNERQQLLKELRITEVNQVAVRLLNVGSCEEAWERLIDDCPRNVTSIGHQIVEAVLTQQHQLELEIQLKDVAGNEQYLWLVMRLPEQPDDFKAVILSISDITSRKLIELSLVERVAEQGGVVALHVGLVDAQQGVAEHGRRAVEVGRREDHHRAMGGDVLEPLLEFCAVHGRQVSEVQLILEPAGPCGVNALGVFFTQAGRRVERVNGGLELGIRVVGTVGCEEELLVADIAAPATDLPGFVMAEGQPKRIIGQLLQTLIIKVRGRVQRGAGEECHPGKAFEHRGNLSRK
jgi:PAS domain-containing protein